MTHLMKVKGVFGRRANQITLEVRKTVLYYEADYSFYMTYDAVGSNTEFANLMSVEPPFFLFFLRN